MEAIHERLQLLSELLLAAIPLRFDPNRLLLRNLLRFLGLLLRFPFVLTLLFLLVVGYADIHLLERFELDKEEIPDGLEFAVEDMHELIQQLACVVDVGWVHRVFAFGLG